MLIGGTGTKRCEINLKKHSANKRSIVRIQNADEMCLARALVSIPKIENDEKYSTINPYENNRCDSHVKHM